MESLFEEVSFLIPNWKWIAIVCIFIGLYFFQVGLKWCIAKIKLNRNYKLDKTFMQFFLRLEIEKSISWILTLLLGNVLIEMLSLTLNLEKYLTLFFKVILVEKLRPQMRPSLVRNVANGLHTRADRSNQQQAGDDLRDAAKQLVRSRALKRSL